MPIKIANCGSSLFANRSLTIHSLLLDLVFLYLVKHLSMQKEDVYIVGN